MCQRFSLSLSLSLSLLCYRFLTFWFCGLPVEGPAADDPEGMYGSYGSSAGLWCQYSSA